MLAVLPYAAMDEYIIIFFFQAEDGIRDKLVTGVQTCALPICRPSPDPNTEYLYYQTLLGIWPAPRRERRADDLPGRSEERRVGKECILRWERQREKKRRKYELHYISNNKFAHRTSNRYSSSHK